MKKTILLIAGLALLIMKTQAQTVTDVDGNVYHTVVIGTQVWMVENLKTTKYSDNTTIPNVSDSLAWDNLTTGAYCNYKNTPSNAADYGRLYNWYAATDAHKICPLGWHVPSDSEWTVLTTYLGGEICGDKLKEAGTAHWATTTAGVTNQTGFTALPGGDRYYYGAFYDIGYNGYWWTSTELDASTAWLRGMSDDSYLVDNLVFQKYNGLSIRCLRDLPAQVDEIDLRDQINIYPNPAKDHVTLTLKENLNAKIRIYNLVGGCVAQQEISNDAKSIQLGSLPKGLYVIEVTTTHWTTQIKLVKE